VVTSDSLETSGALVGLAVFYIYLKTSIIEINVISEEKLHGGY
jgi:hypothetical protein